MNNQPVVVEAEGKPYIMREQVADMVGISASTLFEFEAEGHRVLL